MAQLVLEKQIIEVNGTIDEVLDRAFGEALLSETGHVDLITNHFNIRVQRPYADNGFRVISARMRDPYGEFCNTLEKLVQAFEPEARVWIKGSSFKIQYKPNTRSDSLSKADADRYLEALKAGLRERFSKPARAEAQAGR